VRGDGEEPRIEIPRGAAWQRRWRRLHPDTRAHIHQRVREGAVLREPEWAALAVRLAARRRWDVLITALLAPALGVAALVLGAAAGRSSRGARFSDSLAAALTWHDGWPWLAAVLVPTALLLLATRDLRGRLRQAEVANRTHALRTRRHDQASGHGSLL
jgi:hypothetical protein